MERMIDRQAIRRRIRYRIRRKVSGTAERPRIAVFRSQKHIYAQAIDDTTGRTMAHVSSRDPGLKAKFRSGANVEAAKVVGGEIAARLKGAGIETAVLDRGGYLYHGRVKALADAAREAGLKF